jgi:hypothetical protein
MVKKTIGPKKVMKGLSKFETAKVNFLSLPKPVLTNYDTGYNIEGEKVEGGKAKWEVEIELLQHPNGETGKMVWQTNCQVVRVDLMEWDVQFDKKAALKDLQTFNYIFQTASGTHLCNYDPANEEL